MRLASIASGSSGNCIYVGSESTHILIDTGTSKKKIEMGLHELGLTFSDIDGIFVTHDVRGRLHTYTIRGERTQIEKIFRSVNTVFFEILALSLEEIFISETEVVGYDVRKFILD